MMPRKFSERLPPCVPNINSALSCSISRSYLSKKLLKCSTVPKGPSRLGCTGLARKWPSTCESVALILSSH